MRARRKLPPLQPGQCAAVVDDYDRPLYHAPMQRLCLPGDKRCSRRAKVQVKHLHLCTTHARLAREGLVREDGRVEAKGTISDVRDAAAAGKPLVLNTWAT